MAKRGDGVERLPCCNQITAMWPVRRHVTAVCHSVCQSVSLLGCVPVSSTLCQFARPWNACQLAPALSETVALTQRQRFCQTARALISIYY